jgi:hypothetical protein
MINRLLNEITLADLATLGYVLYNLRAVKVKHNRNDQQVINLVYKEAQLPSHLKIGVGD